MEQAALESMALDVDANLGKDQNFSKYDLHGFFLVFFFFFSFELLGFNPFHRQKYLAQVYSACNRRTWSVGVNVQLAKMKVT